MKHVDPCRSAGFFSSMDHLQQPLLPTATRHSHPEEKAYQVPAGPESLWQWCSFSYIAPLLKAGAALPQLHQHHLPPLPPSAAPDKCGEALWNAWQRELVKQPSPSLLRALFSPFGPQFLSLGLLKLCNDALNFAGPLLLNGLLRYLSDQTEPGADRISTVSSSSSSSSSSSYLDPSSFAFAGGACAALLALSLFLKVGCLHHFKFFLFAYFLPNQSINQSINRLFSMHIIRIDKVSFPSKSVLPSPALFSSKLSPYQQHTCPPLAALVKFKH